MYRNCLQQIGLPNCHAHPLKRILWLAHAVSWLQIVKLSDCHTWKKWGCSSKQSGWGGGHRNLLKETLSFCLIPKLLCWHNPQLTSAAILLHSSGSSLALMILSGSFLTLLFGPYLFGLIFLWFSSQAFLYLRHDLTFHLFPLSLLHDLFCCQGKWLICCVLLWVGINPCNFIHINRYTHTNMYIVLHFR